MIFTVYLFRYSVTFFLVFLILAQNPKVDQINSFARVTQYFSSSSNTEVLLNNITWILILVFFGLTLFLAKIEI